MTATLITYRFNIWLQCGCVYEAVLRV